MKSSLDIENLSEILTCNPNEIRANFFLQIV